MTLEEAKEILDKNALCEEGSLRQSVCEDCRFSEEYFWEFYDSLVTLAEDAKNSKITATDTAKIFAVYDRILEMFRLHCEPDEDVEIIDFPENFSDYFDRLEAAILFYLEGKPIDEDNLDLKRP